MDLRQNLSQLVNLTAGTGVNGLSYITSYTLTMIGLEKNWKPPYIEPAKKNKYHSISQCRSPRVIISLQGTWNLKGTTKAPTADLSFQAFLTPKTPILFIWLLQQGVAIQQLSLGNNFYFLLKWKNAFLQVKLYMQVGRTVDTYKYLSILIFCR